MKHIIITSLLAAGVSSAAVYQIDFGRSTNATTGNWTNVGAATPGSSSLGMAVNSTKANIVDSGGVASSIDLRFLVRGNSDTAGPGADFNGPHPALVAGFPLSALQDGVTVGATAAQFRFEELDTNLTYDFTLYGARGNTGGSPTYTFTGSNSGNASISEVLNNSTEVAVISGIVPKLDGTIDFAMAGTATGSLNMMTMESVPEPSAMLLSCFAGLGLMFRRRR